MQLGLKIKNVRLYKKMTQAELCGDFITRNMLSAIENERALPSLPALAYFAEKLEISASYFFSKDTNPLPYLLEYKLPSLRQLANEQKHAELLEAAIEFEDCMSNELKLLMANSCYVLGNIRLNEGNAGESISLFERSFRLYGELGISNMEMTGKTAKKVAEALKEGIIPTPNECFSHNRSTPDFVFYIFIIYMIDHGMTERASSLYDTIKIEYKPYRYHINSRLAAAKINYERAKELLCEIVFEQAFNIPAPMLSVFLNELEDYCIRTGDFKTAYACTKKRNEIKMR